MNAQAYATAITDTRPQTGMESATTTNISNGGMTHGNEGQNVTTLVAGRRLHGGKPNRSPREQPHDDDQHHQQHEHGGDA
jgi:hypothetical protein